MSQLAEQATRHQVFAEGAKTRYTNDLLDILRDIEEELIGRIANYDVQSWTRIRAENQLSAFQEVAKAKYKRKMIPVLNKQIAEFSSYEAGFEVRSLSNIAPAQNFLLPSEIQIKTAIKMNPLSVKGPDGGKLLEPFIEEFVGDQGARVTQAIRSGFALGDTTQTIVQRIKQEVFQLSRRAITAMARTSLQHASAQARQATYEANKDIVKRIRILATLDTRTTDICMSLDGREFPLDEGPRPPFHIQCRTTFTAVLDQRFDILDKGATRRERDPVTGEVDYVPAKQTYYGWLKTQPKKIQNEIIGPTRAKLLRDGGLSAQRFSELGLNRNFKPRTLEEMRKLEPLAFEKAGVEL